MKKYDELLSIFKEIRENFLRIQREKAILAINIGNFVDEGMYKAYLNIVKRKTQEYNILKDECKKGGNLDDSIKIKTASAYDALVVAQAKLKRWIDETGRVAVEHKFLKKDIEFKNVSAKLSKSIVDMKVECLPLFYTIYNEYLNTKAKNLEKYLTKFDIFYEEKDQMNIYKGYVTNLKDAQKTKELKENQRVLSFASGQNNVESLTTKTTIDLSKPKKVVADEVIVNVEVVDPKRAAFQKRIEANKAKAAAKAAKKAAAKAAKEAAEKE